MVIKIRSLKIEVSNQVLLYGLHGQGTEAWGHLWLIEETWHVAFVTSSKIPTSKSYSFTETTKGKFEATNGSFNPTNGLPKGTRMPALAGNTGNKIENLPHHCLPKSFRKSCLILRETGISDLSAIITTPDDSYRTIELRFTINARCT